ncbi:D-amino-acid transaminase [Anaerobacillus sp. MEB173]|uniref:D-amino-acid transaminase n=1 Tax=Anaerobacillus sp. MEB173 TaxID=3383345 RepID=UPI003F8F919B
MDYVIYNNQIVPKDSVHISMEDRGYNFGDGIYEVIRIYNGTPYTMEEHYERFSNSAKKLEMTLPYPIETFYMLTEQLIRKNEIRDGLFYLQYTRAVAPRNHLYERNMEGVVTAFTREVPLNIKDQSEGIAVIATDDIRWLRCDIKTINLLGNTMALRKAADNKCSEAILHRNHLVTECAASNVFIVKDKKVYTHPATNLILNGITRQLVLHIANELGLELFEQPFTLEHLMDADEVFITNTNVEIAPVISISGDISNHYSIGPITRKLQSSFTERKINALTK